MVVRVKYPKVAIIVPVFNGANHLRDCLLSIKNQTFANFKVFVANDGSVDDTGAVAQEIIKGDDRFEYLYYDNAGVGATRNKVLDIIFKEGGFEYIAFVDGDDVLSEFYLERMLYCIYSNSADVCVCGYSRFNENNNYRKKSYPSLTVCIELEFIDIIFSRGRWEVSAVAGGMVWKQMYRAEVLRGVRFPIERDIVEDELFCLRVALVAKKYVLLPEELYFYRQRCSHRVFDVNYLKRLIAGRERCLLEVRNSSEYIRARVFSSFLRFVLSGLKSEGFEFNLNDYKDYYEIARRLGFVRLKDRVLFWMFSGHPVLSVVYKNLRRMFKSVIN